MGPASNTLPSEPATERPAAPISRRNDSGIERRIPNARETLATLPEVEEVDFEPHDTIPAPPWLDDEIAPPAKTP